MRFAKSKGLADRPCRAASITGRACCPAAAGSSCSIIEPAAYPCVCLASSTASSTECGCIHQEARPGAAPAVCIAIGRRAGRHPSASSLLSDEWLERSALSPLPGGQCVSLEIAPLDTLASISTVLNPVNKSDF